MKSYSQLYHHFNKVCSLESYLKSIGLYPEEIVFTWHSYRLAESQFDYALT